MKVFIGPYPDNGENRQLDIQIDHYDTWDMFTTLAPIIVPMLKQLKATKHGIPGAIFSDSYFAQYTQYEFDFIDHKIDEEAACKKWDETLDAMIWSFEQVIEENDPRLERGAGTDKYIEYQDQVDFGLELFGKHYRNLWD